MSVDASAFQTSGARVKRNALPFLPQIDWGVMGRRATLEPPPTPARSRPDRAMIRRARRAATMRLHRARVKRGRKVLRIEIDDVSVPHKLFQMGLLAPDAGDDEVAITAALTRMIEIVCRDDAD